MWQRWRLEESEPVESLTSRASPPRPSLSISLHSKNLPFSFSPLLASLPPLITQITQPTCWVWFAPRAPTSSDPLRSSQGESLLNLSLASFPSSYALFIWLSWTHNDMPPCTDSNMNKDLILNGSLRGHEIPKPLSQFSFCDYGLCKHFSQSCTPEIHLLLT